MPAGGQGGAAAAERRHAAALPGLHLGRPHALHAAPLPRRHPHARRLHALARAAGRRRRRDGAGRGGQLIAERNETERTEADFWRGPRGGFAHVRPHVDSGPGRRWHPRGPRAPRRLPILDPTAVHIHILQEEAKRTCGLGWASLYY